MPGTSPEITAIKELESLPESLRLFFFQIVTLAINLAAKIEITPETIDNLQQIDKQLAEKSAVFYGYHSSLFDALVLPILVRQHLNNLDKMLLPITVDHSQGLKRLFLSILASLSHAEFIPVVRKKDEPLYSHNLKRQLLKYLIETTREYLEKPGNAYGVAPMGTRSHVLSSERVNPGFIKVAQKHQVPLVPIAFTKDDNNHLAMSVGEILSPPTSSDDLTEATQFYMRTLAQMIPPELRGDYS